MKTVDNTIVITTLSSKTSDELDFAMYNDVLGKEKTDAAYEEEGVEEIYINTSCFDNQPIKIETLKKILEKLEKDGCNYVSIDYHSDHLEYKFYGSGIRSATEKEIEDFNYEEKMKTIERNNALLAEIERKKLKLIQETEKLKNEN